MALCSPGHSERLLPEVRVGEVDLVSQADPSPAFSLVIAWCRFGATSTASQDAPVISTDALFGALVVLAALLVGAWLPQSGRRLPPCDEQEPLQPPGCE